MKKFFEGIVNAKTDQWIGFVFFCVVSSLGILLITALASDHKPECYYIESVATSGGVVYKVTASLPWAPDETSVDTLDLNVALYVLSGFKQCAGK
jgi:hypothetical protein